MTDRGRVHARAAALACLVRAATRAMRILHPSRPPGWNTPLESIVPLSAAYCLSAVGLCIDIDVSDVAPRKAPDGRRRCMLSLE